jgi:hypothetical protein
MWRSAVKGRRFAGMQPEKRYPLLMPTTLP